MKSRNSLRLMIAFMDLLVKLNVHKLPRRELGPFANFSEHILVDKGNKVSVAPVLAKLPSDQEVRQFTWGYPRRIHVDMRDLIKLLDVCKPHHTIGSMLEVSLLSRGVVVGDANGTLKDVVKHDKKKKSFLGQGYGNGMPQIRPTKNARPFANMASFATHTSQIPRNTDLGKVGSSEHMPAPRRPSSVLGETPVPLMATPTPAEARSTHDSPSGLPSSKVAGEMIRVQLAVLAHIRDWKFYLPGPETSTWEDLLRQERAMMRKHITAFIQDNDLIDMDTTPDSVATLLADDDFPAKEGKNSGAITSCPKVCYGKETTKKKKATSAAGSSVATNVVSDGSDDEYGDDAPASASKGKKNGRASTSRGRTRSTDVLQCAREEHTWDIEEAEDLDHQLFRKLHDALSLHE